MFLGELQLRHPCLVRMIGYCCEEEHRRLVSERLAHGSLDDYFFQRTDARNLLALTLSPIPHMCKSENDIEMNSFHVMQISAFYHPVLPWSTRLSIVLATAKGLVSLHGAEKPLICGEFNASDILLDSVGDHSASLALVKC